MHKVSIVIFINACESVSAFILIEESQIYYIHINHSPISLKYIDLLTDKITTSQQAIFLVPMEVVCRLSGAQCHKLKTTAPICTVGFYKFSLNFFGFGYFIYAADTK